MPMGEAPISSAVLPAHQPTEKSSQQGINQPETHDTERQDVSPRYEEENGSDKAALKNLGWLDRLLALWIFLAMAIGIILGNTVPHIGQSLQRGELVGVSIPIAVGLLVMMYPILCKVRFESLPQIFSEREVWKQIAFSLVMNWIVAPFFMLGLAWAFLPDEESLRQGLILVGLARCIAMVLIWNSLAGGNAEYCAILVAINSILQMVLFAPMAVFFLQVISDKDGEKDIDYSVVATSVAIFLGIPLGAALLTRFTLRTFVNPSWYDRVFIKYVSPLSLIGLLYTIIVLFASQGKHVVDQIVSVVRIAAPLVVYFVVIFSATLWLSRWAGFSYAFSATQSFTAASNNFELAIAVAVATFGADSEQALAATVGPLIEVPVLVALVYGVRWISGRLFKNR